MNNDQIPSAPNNPFNSNVPPQMPPQAPAPTPPMPVAPQPPLEQPPVMNQPNRGGRKKWIIIGAIILGALLVGGGAWAVINMMNGSTTDYGTANVEKSPTLKDVSVDTSVTNGYDTTKRDLSETAKNNGVLGITSYTEKGNPLGVSVTYHWSNVKADKEDVVINTGVANDLKNETESLPSEPVKGSDGKSYDMTCEKLTTTSASMKLSLAQYTCKVFLEDGKQLLVVSVTDSSNKESSYKVMQEFIAATTLQF